MTDWVALGPVTRFPVGSAVAARLGSLAVVVVRADEDAWFVTEDMCPHLGLGLVGGLVRGGRLSCPHHAYTYDLATGCRVVSGGLAPGAPPPRFADDDNLVPFGVRVLDGEVQARLPA